MCKDKYSSFYTLKHEENISFKIHKNLVKLAFYVCILAVDRSSSELQWLLDLVQNDPVHYIRSVMISNNVCHCRIQKSIFGGKTLILPIAVVMRLGMLD